MPFVPPPPLTEGVFTSPLVNPSLIENASPSELKVEPRSPSPIISENIDIPEVGTGTRHGTSNTDAAAYFCLIVFLNMKELLIFSFYQLNRIYSDFI